MGVRNSAQAEANRQRAWAQHGSSFLAAQALHRHQGITVTAERGQRSQGYTRCFLKIKNAVTVLFLPPPHWEYEIRL